MMNFVNFIAVTLVFGSVAHPTCTSFRYRPLMWNLAGTSAVILKQGFGPDGGGSIELILTTFNAEPIQALITSNMSHSDGSTPESVSMKTCAEKLQILNQKLGAQSFQNNLHESTCKPERSYLFNRKLDTIAVIDEKKKAEILKQIDYKREALVYSANQNNLIVVESASSCTADCFWVSFDSAKNLYQKQDACLP